MISKPEYRSVRHVPLGACKMMLRGTQMRH